MSLNESNNQSDLSYLSPPLKSNNKEEIPSWLIADDSPKFINNTLVDCQSDDGNNEDNCLNNSQRFDENCEKHCIFQSYGFTCNSQRYDENNEDNFPSNSQRDETMKITS